MYFSSVLLCCNASAFVICAIKNYLLTYLRSLGRCKYASVMAESIKNNRIITQAGDNIQMPLQTALDTVSVHV